MQDSYDSTPHIGQALAIILNSKARSRSLRSSAASAGGHSQCRRRAIQAFQVEHLAGHLIAPRHVDHVRHHEARVGTERVRGRNSGPHPAVLPLLLVRRDIFAVWLHTFQDRLALEEAFHHALLRLLQSSFECRHLHRKAEALRKHVANNFMKDDATPRALVVLRMLSFTD